VVGIQVSVMLKGQVLYKVTIETVQEYLCFADKAMRYEDLCWSSKHA